MVEVEMFFFSYHYGRLKDSNLLDIVISWLKKKRWLKECLLLQ